MPRTWIRGYSFINVVFTGAHRTDKGTKGRCSFSSFQPSHLLPSLLKVGEALTPSLPPVPSSSQSWFSLYSFITVVFTAVYGADKGTQGWCSFSPLQPFFLASLSASTPSSFHCTPSARLYRFSQRSPWRTPRIRNTTIQKTSCLTPYLSKYAKKCPPNIFWLVRLVYRFCHQHVNKMYNVQTSKGVVQLI